MPFAPEVPPVQQTLRPARFYGWVVVAAAMLITFTSGPGQSYTFSVVIAPILAETGLSRTLLSALHAGGTAVSAAMTFGFGLTCEVQLGDRPDH